MSLSTTLRRTAVRGSRAWHRLRSPGLGGPPDPPACPPGWSVGPPDFVGVGAQKAGTSWWNALLHQHPAVHRSGGLPKELHFFDGYWEAPWTDADARRYARYFPRPEGGVAGEWTPGYMIDFWTPDLIARAAPEARILVLLRDPVERFRSGLTHTDDATARSLTHRDAAGAFARGLYAQQLRRLFDAVPRERVLLLQYERCSSDPAGELTPPRGHKVEPSLGLLAALRDGYAIDLDELRTLVPEMDLSRWPTAHEAGLA